MPFCLLLRGCDGLRLPLLWILMQKSHTRKGNCAPTTIWTWLFRVWEQMKSPNSHVLLPAILRYIEFLPISSSVESEIQRKTQFNHFKISQVTLITPTTPHPIFFSLTLLLQSFRILFYLSFNDISLLLKISIKKGGSALISEWRRPAFRMNILWYLEEIHCEWL